MFDIQRLKRQFVGDRAFYRTVLGIVLPIIVQMSVTNFVNLLDNIMVGQLGTAELSGVAIGNQLLFVLTICLFGGMSGPSIFSAQFFGANDMEGVRNSLRLKLWTGFALFILFCGIFLSFGPQLVGTYLTGDGDPAAAALMMEHALDYVHIMLIGYVPLVISFSLSSTLRESGETILPMKAGIAAVLTNLVGNYLLIFGNFGFPKLGVQGAAIATVLSRFVEMAIVLQAARRGSRFAFLHGVLRTMRLPWQFVKSVHKKGAPLLANEVLWSVGMATLAQIYSLRGLDVLAAYNIANVVNQVFIVLFLSVGNAVAIMVGQHLGADRHAEAKQTAWRLMALGVSLCVVVGAVMAVASPYIPLLYNTTENVRHLATQFILTLAVFMPMYSVSHASFFTLRSGGSTLLTFLFDSAYMWVIHIPIALALAHWTDMPITVLFPLCEAIGILKMLFGLHLLRSGRWMRNIVATQAT